MSSLAETAIDAVAAIEQVCSRIEDSFFRAGDQLGRGHELFQELNQGLTALSRELSGAEIEGASRALQNIAERLNGLADALPAESALLDTIGKGAAEAGSLLKPLFKHVQMITIIARSAKIEAASLDGDRENFLAFTEEAHNLGNAVERSIKDCERDQQLLAQAVETALSRQKDFELKYRAQLSSAAADLISAHAGIKQQRNSSVQLADLAGASTKRIAEAVGRLIVSMQAGDSTRQRLEHVCQGLRRAVGSMSKPAIGSGLIVQLQAAQLKDAQSEFDRDIDDIIGMLSAILGDAVAIVGRDRSSDGGKEGGSASFLAQVKQTLAQALSLVATCESAGKLVDDALTIVEDTLGKFRHATAGLAEAVVDITLIGMNASLKAGHLGSKGNAFVVIANELKVTADHVAGGGARLKPIFDGVEQAANELRELRAHDDPTQLAKLEPSILKALQEAEIGNERLARLMARLADEGAEFEALMNSARQLMEVLSEGVATLPAVAARLDAAGAAEKVTPGPNENTVLDDLHAHYTMERERDVHREFLRRFGMASKAVVQEAEMDDGVLLF
jgi:hypothetical protein